LAVFVRDTVTVGCQSSFGETGIWGIVLTDLGTL
jgi:hypothetical protein